MTLLSGEFIVFALTGIDKWNVRFVVHASIPTSFGDYVQHIGRAGRDGELSDAIILYSPRDVERAVQVVSRKKSGSELQDVLLRVLDFHDFLESSAECRRSLILQHFDEDPATCVDRHGETCDVCHVIP